MTLVRLSISLVSALIVGAVNTYLFSAMSGYLLTSILRISRVEEVLKSPVNSLMDATFYAVLLHHHAMDTAGRAREMLRRVKPPSRDELISDLEMLSDLIADNVVRDAYLGVLKSVINSILEDVSRGLVNIIKSVRSEYLSLLKRSAGFRGRRVLYLLVTSALVVADYLAAGEVRGESKSRFFSVVREFSKVFMTPDSRVV